MKTSLKKLQKFAALRHDIRAPKQYQPIAHDELARATQDMNDMRDCYDSLLSAAAATANSVYEFSESLTEMGDCLLEKTALNDDEESGKVLLMLGKVQFELQKLVDAYRSHIFRTITVPSESLLNELCIVEEMKKQCDGKREIYEDMMEKQKEKGRLRGSKGECFSSCQLQAAHDEYDEVANVFVLRVKSLKQAQSHSLLTQASRHHAAQLCFFKKAMKSLEAIEPDVRLVSEQQHIDYQFSGVKDDELEILDNDNEETDSDEDFDTEDGSGSEIHDDGELSFEHGQNGPVQEAPSTKHLMELDDTLISPETKLGAAKKLFPSARRNSFSFGREMRAICKSAPLFPDKKHSSSSPSRRKFTSYVLPTPDQTKGPFSGKLEDNKVPQTTRAPSNLWHSSPLNPNRYGKLRTNDKFSGPIILDAHSVLKESNNTRKASQLPPPLSEGLSFNPKFVSNAAKKVKRQQSAFSGPIITSKTTWPNSTNPNYFSASGPIVSSGYPPPFSGPLLRAPLAQPTSTPKISELHELPRPPPNHLAAKKPTNHSGPLLTQRHAPLESSVNPKITYNIMSPPLTPVSLTNIQPVIES